VLEEVMGDTVLARVIIEMLGAPKEHIEKTMRDYVDKLRKEETVVKSDIAEAEKEEGKEIFGIYAELEIKFKDLAELLDFCFENMPSSVEVVEPGELSIKLNKLNGFLNDLQARLHEADAIIKTGKMTQQVLDANATNIFRRFLIALVEHNHKTAGEMSHYVGVHPSKLIPFLAKLVEEKKIKKDGDNYLPA
jgi:hypothetical protein